mmetsp:Transcript_37097/g.92348  ORF Transcript_37097/g.92348 Transcript_37097/m.92348 type:complete len:220 (+) Transcript_37097:1272-1931(+)
MLVCVELRRVHQPVASAHRLRNHTRLVVGPACAEPEHGHRAAAEAQQHARRVGCTVRPLAHQPRPFPHGDMVQRTVGAHRVWGQGRRRGRQSDEREESAHLNRHVLLDQRGLVAVLRLDECRSVLVQQRHAWLPARSTRCAPVCGSSVPRGAEKQYGVANLAGDELEREEPSAANHVCPVVEPRIQALGPPLRARQDKGWSVLVLESIEWPQRLQSQRV